MRATALFRWGLTCLLLAPLAFLAWLLSPGTTTDMLPSTPESLVVIATTWGVLAPILAVLLVGGGALLNLLAIRRGVRGLDRVARGDWEAPTGSIGPGPRIIYPADWELEHPSGERQRLPRSALGLGLAAALVAWAGFVGWVIVVEHPLALAGGARHLDAVYAAWNPVSRAGFAVAVVVWSILALIGVLVVALLARSRRPALDRLLRPHRFIAFAAITASAIAVAAQVPIVMLGMSLVDDLPGAENGLSAGLWLVHMAGVSFSAAAILLTVPRWSGSLSDRAAASP